MVLPLKVSPGGSFADSTVKVVPEVEVPCAVIVYVNTSPSLPLTESELVIFGETHTGGIEVTVTVAVALTVCAPSVQVMV